MKIKHYFTKKSKMFIIDIDEINLSFEQLIQILKLFVFNQLVLILDSSAIDDNISFLDSQSKNAAHKANPYRSHLSFVINYRNLTYDEARGIEQRLIEQHHTLNRENPMNNQINGISWKNKNFNKYMKAAESILGGETYVG